MRLENSLKISFCSARTWKNIKSNNNTSPAEAAASSSSAAAAPVVAVAMALLCPSKAKLSDETTTRSGRSSICSGWRWRVVCVGLHTRPRAPVSNTVQPCEDDGQSNTEKTENIAEHRGERVQEYFAYLVVRLCPYQRVDDG